MKHHNLFRRKLIDRLVRIFSGAAVLFAVGMMLWIIGSVFHYGGRALSWDFLTHSSQPYGVGQGGIANALIGTILITLGAAGLAVPPAVLAGIALSEFRDHPRLNAALRFTANVLMGLPSILVGLFVYTILVAPTGHFSGFAGSLALAIIMFPLIMRTTEEMLGMVPYSLREAVLALGLSRIRTTRMVCKSARSGLATGILLALARVGGETAPLLFTALFADRYPWHYFTGPTANLPVLITEYATNSPFESMHQAGWGAALAVTTLVLAINLATRIFFAGDKHGH